MAVDLNATTDTVNYGTGLNSTLDGISALSVCFYVYPTSWTNTYRFFSDGAGGEGTDGHFVIMSLNSDIYVSFTSSTSTIRDFETTNTISLNVWHRIVVTFGSGTDENIFINGVDRALTTKVNNTISAFATDTDELRIGYHAGASRNAVQGRYAEAAIWTRKLGDAEALAISNGVSPRFFPEGRVFYDPLITTSSYDLDGGIVPTHTSTANIAHPRVIYPHSDNIIAFPTVPPTRSLHPFRRRRTIANCNLSL